MYRALMMYIPKGALLCLLIWLILLRSAATAPFDGKECKLTQMGTAYKGNLTITVTRAACLRWDTVAHPYKKDAFFPDDSVSSASNYCRNPDRKDGGPWCFTSANGATWEFCNVEMCDCRTNRAAPDYSGKMAVTESGKTCQAWSSQEPHRHGYYYDYLFPEGSASAAENYCRNPGGEEPLGPWCYTTDQDTRWEYCSIPYCECKEYPEGWYYRGNNSMTETGKTCQRWDSQTPHAHSYNEPSLFPEGNATLANNYCRNPDVSETEGPWCFTTDPQTQWEYCRISLCELENTGAVATTTSIMSTISPGPTSHTAISNAAIGCKFTMAGTSYAGSMTRTVSGRTCQRWDQQAPHRHSFHNPDWFPDNSISDASNFCRNPDDLEPNGPWCYTTDPNKRWDYCDIPMCDCKLTQSGTWYMGMKNVTVRGKTCQRWDSQRPHQHGYTNPSWYPDGSLQGAENFCRNPDLQWAHGTWCYTTDSSVRWDHCAIPFCDCQSDRQGLTFQGKVNVTSSGKSCQNWASQSPHPHRFNDSAYFPDESVDDLYNFCRNPDSKSGGPWCYTTDANVEWEYCNIAFCELTVIQYEQTERKILTRSECRHSALGKEYIGSVSRTYSNYTCQNWNQQSPHQHPYLSAASFPDASLDVTTNKCRNPDGREGGPWCYTTRPDVEWEYCPVPACDCKQTMAGLDYMGRISQTSGERSCQRWDSQSPHAHSFTNASLFPDPDLAAVGNMCRNPDKDEPYGPWCFTTDPQIRWQYCDIPFCDCKVTGAGLEYGGHMRKTRTGRICQRWDAQLPHRHGYNDPSMFPNDDSTLEAQNFCRNPDVNEPNGPWCYTTDPYKRWEYCDIPYCVEPTTTTSSTTTSTTTTTTRRTTRATAPSFTKPKEGKVYPTKKYSQKDDRPKKIRGPEYIVGKLQEEKNSDAGGMSVGAIVGIVIAVFIVFLVIVLVVAYVLVTKLRRDPNPSVRLKEEREGEESASPPVSQEPANAANSGNFSNPIYFSKAEMDNEGDVVITHLDQKDMQKVDVPDMPPGETIY